jgi:hypothetical protein
MTNNHPHKVGDIFYNSWGYDQTNIYWYVVVRATKTSIRVMQLQGQETGDPKENARNMQAMVIPHLAIIPVNGKTYIKRVQKLQDGREYIKMDYGCLSKWDGKPKHSSWYG